MGAGRHEIWRQGLLDYDEVVGIDWAWLAADGAMTKAPLGLYPSEMTSVEPNLDALIEAAEA